MGHFKGPVFVLTACLCLKYGLAYLESLAANTDAASLSDFEPSVAFICNKPAMHRVVNGWEADYDTDCIEDPQEILEYCKKIYPDHDIKNIVEPSNKKDKRKEIRDWPKFDEKDRTAEISGWPKFKHFDGPEADKKGNHTVKYYTCLVKDFESEALLVPQHCVFDHEHDADLCAQPDHWIQTAQNECRGRDMVLESSGMLVLCGTDAFKGVEYVCCPKEHKEVPVLLPGSENGDDDYSRYLRGDDMREMKKEHSRFKAALKAMKKKQHEKVTKMMKEWQEARAEFVEMKKTDKDGAEQLNKEITERYQRMYHAFVMEAESEKKQLVAVHQQRVQAGFNKRKRQILADYKEALESANPTTSRIFDLLKAYIKVEEHDRLHSVNHFEHVRDTNPQEAENIRKVTKEHLNNIDKGIEDAIRMLHRDPDMEVKIRPEIAKFRDSRYRKIELSESDVVQIPDDKVPAETVAPIDIAIESVDSDDSSESQEGDITNIQIDTEGLTIEDTNNKPYKANAQSNGHGIQMQSFSDNSRVAAFVPTYTAGSVVGIAIGSVAVFIIIVVAVVMLRKRSRRQPITHGFVEVDPAASPEERHVANMQMNGYENPTYRYFEMQN